MTISCPQFTNLGYLIDGGCAEFVRCPDVNCFPYPENLVVRTSSGGAAGVSDGVAHADGPARNCSPAKRC